MNDEIVKSFQTMMENLLAKFTTIMDQQYKQFSTVLETKLDAFQNEIFAYKEENLALKKRIEVLEKYNIDQFQREKTLSSQLRETQVAVNKQAQKKHSNDLVLITEAENTPTHLPSAESRSSTAQKSKEGKYIRTVTFTSLDSKISYLAKRRSFNFTVLPSLCPELRHLQNETKKLVESGKIKKSYVYKDQIMCILNDESKFCCMCLVDLYFLRSL